MRSFQIILCILFAAVGTGSLRAQEKEIRVNTDAFYKGRLASLIRDTADISALIDASKKYHNDTAASLLRQAIQRSTAIGYSDGIAKAMLGLGTYYFNTGKLDSSMQLFRRAEPFCRHAFFFRQKLLVNLYNNIAANYSVRGQTDSGIYYFYLSVKQLEQERSPDLFMLAHLYCNIGSTWLMTDQLEKAVYYLRKAETIALKSGNRKELGNIYANMAAALSASSQDSASDYALKALAITEAYGDRAIEQSIYYTLGNLYTTNHDPEKAIPYFKKAMAIASGNPLETILKPNFGLSNAYLQLNEVKEAKEALLKAAEVVEQAGMRDKAAFFIYSNLADVYNHSGNYKLAYEFRTRAFLLEDSLLNAEKLLSAGQLEVKYRTLQKDRELIAKQLQITTKENQLRKKNATIGAISVVSVLLGLLITGLYRNNKQQQKIQLERMRNLQHEQEIGNLKSMIRGEEKERSRLARELHDGILVMFSGIKMKLRGLPKYHKELQDTEDYKDVLLQMDHATKELRRTAHNLMPDMLLDGGLAEAVYYFCSKLQESTGLQISFQQYGELPRLQPEFELSIYRIVQELVQNILKHAQASKAIVQLNYRMDLLYITVEDNGVGFSKTSTEGQNGMGLRSIRNRVRALNGMMDLRTNEPLGTTIYLEFDVRSVILNNKLAYDNKSSNNR
jgi:signal transduction histidine kinase